MSRFLGDNDIECYLCDGTGVIQDTDETCWMCHGIGRRDLEVFDAPAARDFALRRERLYRNEIWSPLLCAEDTIERITGHSDDNNN